MPKISRAPVWNPVIEGRSRQDAKAETKRLVLEAAILLFERDGYEATTIRDIAAKAGRSTGAIFANWESKDELYADIYGFKPVSVEQGRELLGALAKCAAQFRRVEDSSRKKASLIESLAEKPGPQLEWVKDRAEQNRAFAEMCEGLLKGAGWRVPS